MLQNNFQQRKKNVLLKLDKSSKKSWDERIVKLCGKINSLENYYTTSSCSGRVVVMIDQDKKGPELFKFVSHDLIIFDGLKKDLERVDTLRAYPETFSGKMFTRGIKFKLEPCILHVACKSLEDAQRLLDKAKLSGWKKSGIISFGKNIVLELNSTERLEFPIIMRDKILVNDEFLKVIVRESNEKLKKSWWKIDKLEEFLR